MSIITQTDMLGLDLTLNGLPFVQLSKENSLGLDLTLNGLPFVTPSDSSEPPVTYNATQFFIVF